MGDADENPVAAMAPVVEKKDISKEFSSAVDYFMKEHYLCNQGKKQTVYIKPFGSNFYEKPHLESYVKKLCDHQVGLNECIKLVPTIKSNPRFVVESHIVKDARALLLVNIVDNKNKDILYTTTIPFMISDIDNGAYIDHRANVVNAKDYAFLTLTSDVKAYTFEDTYTVKGPRVNKSYSNSHEASGEFNAEASGEYSTYGDEESEGGGSASVSRRAGGRGSSYGSSSKQESMTYSIGDSAIYPIEQTCYVNGALKKANEDNVYFRDAVEANKKLYFTFSFVGAEWDALYQTQKKHKKYKKNCYIIPKPDETIMMTVKYVYQKDKKGIYVEAQNDKNQTLKVYFY